jgi:hypothetical protein
MGVNFAQSWLELVALGLARAQFRAQLGYFEGFLRLMLKRLDARKPLSDTGFVGTEGGN